MTPKFHIAVLTACLLVSPAAGGAQTNSGDVTFSVPVNLTQLQPDVEKVQVECFVFSDAITVNRQLQKTGSGMTYGPGQVSGDQEIPVSAGRVVATATVVVVVAANLQDPVGKQAQYTCLLRGFSRSQQTWKPFQTNIFEPNTAFHLTPPTDALRGTFTW